MQVTDSRGFFARAAYGAIPVAPLALYRLVAFPAALAYGAAARLRRWMYRGDVCRAHSLGAATISVGNITAGGTGKTPMVAWVVQWLTEHGICPLYTPLGGSWLNMSESIQRILQRRALAGQSPDTPDEIIELLEATARGWNRNPTPFVWGGKRAARRERSRNRRHAVGGSGACTKRPIRRRQTKVEKWRSTNQVTH